MIRTAAMTCWSAPDRGKKCDGLPTYWALSLGLALRWFDRVILITDKEGENRLIGKYGLPFSEVRVVLDDQFEPAQSLIWSAGKVWTYQHMAAAGEPFLHLDNDVFLWKKPPDRILEAPFFIQSLERFRTGTGDKFHYAYDNKNLDRQIPVLPPDIRAALKLRSHGPWNAGIIGGSNTDFIQRYAEEVLGILREPGNQAAWQFLGGSASSLFLEQYCGAVIGERERQTVETLMSDQCTDMECLLFGYSHFLGPAKYGPDIQQRVAHRLEKEFPDLYRQIT